MLLNEIVDNGISVDKVKNDCKKFLSMINGDIKKYPIYRGLSKKLKVLVKLILI